MSFSGIITAPITPFIEGRLDKAGFFNLLRFQVQEGVNQFVLASTTGENPTLEDEEAETLCRWFKEFEAENKLSLKLILATGSASTKKTMEKTKKAVDLGAQATLVVVPYYNIPSQKGLILHFEKVAGQSPLPLILYNVPSRSACSLQPETVKILSQTENIVGIKEATGDMEFVQKIKQLCPEDFLFFSGDDLTCAEFFNLGGQGAISAGANVLAKELIDLFNSPPPQRLEKIKKYKNFLEELFRETNPVGLKQVLYEKGLINSPELRLPLLFIKNQSLSSALKGLNKSFSLKP